MPEPACCLSGFVFMDGQAIAGAEVQVQSPRGDQVTLITQVHSGVEPRPYYQASLDESPLAIHAGEIITVTARYSSHERSLTYKTLPGSQQVDVVLSRNQADDYIVDQQIWGQAETGKLNESRGMAIDSSGNVYVVDSQNARVQVFDAKYQVLLSWGTLGNLPGEFSYPLGIAIDASDNIYVTDTRNHRIQKFTRQGMWLTTWGGLGSANGQLNYPMGIAIDLYGNVYVVDTSNNRIQKFDGDGTWLKSWGTGGSNQSQFLAPRGVAVDTSGNVYVTDAGNNRVQKFSSEGTWLASWIIPPDSGSVLLGDPYAIAVGADGAIYVSDIRFHRVVKLSPAGTVLTTWGGNGSSVQFLDPQGVMVDSGGDVYVSESYGNHIRKFSSSGVVLADWGTTGQGNGQFLWPKGLVVGPDGTIYIMDTHHHRIEILSATGEWLANWGAAGAAIGNFNHPHRIVLAGIGTFYVADTNNHRIQKLDSNGNPLASWGSNGTGNGQFSFPVGVAADQVNNLFYVADTYNHRIQKFTSAGVWLSSWGSLGSGPGQFNYPWSVAVDHNSNVYVVDKDNHRIQKFDRNGTLLITWGGGGSARGLFSSPTDVTIDSSDNVYVTDSGNHRIQKFTSAGVWLSSWGVSGSALGQFNTPWGVTTNQVGKVYVADTVNDRIQIFRPMTYTDPIATIQHLSGVTLDPGDTLEIQGLGQDSDETPQISAYEWTSSIDGVISTSATLSRTAESLSPGVHQISLRVQDSEGLWSEPTSEFVTVNAPAQVHWGMLLYLDGDYGQGSNLLNNYNTVINEMRSHMSNRLVEIAVQIDGPKNNDTRRIVIRANPSGGLPLVEDKSYPEQTMDDPATLADFIRWGQTNIVVPHYYLAVANHGQGLQGIAWDKTSDPNGGAYLTIQELGQALNTPGLKPIDILHLDACSMNLLEVAYEVRDRVSIMIASQYLSWSYFAYNEYKDLVSETTTPQDLALGITRTYAEFAKDDYHPFTIAALNTQRVEPMFAAVDRLAAELNALIENGQLTTQKLAEIRQSSQTFESNGDYRNTNTDVYVDLLDWADNVQKEVPAVESWANALINELKLTSPYGLILDNRFRSGTYRITNKSTVYVDLTGTHGVSIYYPLATNPLAFEIYAGQRSGVASLQGAATAGTQQFEFAISSRWSSFLEKTVPTGLPEPLPGPQTPLQDIPSVFLPLIRR